MSQAKLSDHAFCSALMFRICMDIYGSAERQVGFLRHGPRTPADEYMGRYVLALASLPFTEEQLDALESAFRQAHEHLLGSLFSLIDGSCQPPGWPDELRLVNMDTGQIVCPEGLQWAFGLALAEYRARSSESDLAAQAAD